MKYLWISFWLSILSMRTFACAEFEHPEFIYAPNPNWLWNTPESTDSVEVVAKVKIDDKGGVTLLEIISMDPKLDKTGPIEEAIDRSRFTPGRVRVKPNSEWTYQIMDIEYRFKFSW